ncbi:transmembrane channel-like protein 5 [Engraulis encrasicolus]|uniref:transmembrane channel-like protein 5 n=1 Tax=Engraulis encrasicolus TaxID=184585 RepID=UPI002FD6D4C5
MEAQTPGSRRGWGPGELEEEEEEEDGVPKTPGNKRGLGPEEEEEDGVLKTPGNKSALSPGEATSLAISHDAGIGGGGGVGGGGASRGDWREGWGGSSSSMLPRSVPASPPTETPRWQPIQSYTIAMRHRGTTKSMSMWGLTEEDIQEEMENEEQDLVKSLVAMSNQDCDTAIRALAKSFNEKKHIRSQVMASRSVRRKHQLTCCADCSGRLALFQRRLRMGLASARQALVLWQAFLKEVGGKFGSSVLSYFLFLKWLLMFNLLSFLVTFSFITIPQLVSGHDANNTEPFTGLELLTGTGYFSKTVMYYGGYSNNTVGMSPSPTYNLQLAYLFTIAAYMLLCGISLLYSMATSFQKNFVLQGASGGAWTVLCSWDFGVTSEKAVHRRKANLTIQLKESLADKAQKDQLSSSEQCVRLLIHLGTWFLSTGLAVGSCAAIYFLSEFEQELHTKDASSDNKQLIDASTLLVPFVVSLVNLVIPLIYSLFNKIEHFANPRMQVYTVIIRNVLLKMSILGILCYYWMDQVADSSGGMRDQCWETAVGQALYRLVVVDFFFLLLGSFFGEFLSNVIGSRLGFGIPEFDIARNVLDLIYSQTLAWIATFFSPLLTIIQILKFFILFYVKKVSLMNNCQPPRRTGRAAQMQTCFIALLFFPSYVGALAIVAYTVWSLEPSESCGPFRSLEKPFEVVEQWMDMEEQEWVVWIYENVIKSELFFYLLALFMLVVTYFFWQVTRGRKLLIVLLRQRIVNEGTDKVFLLDRLKDLQKANKASANKPKNKRKPNQRNVSNRQWYSEPDYEPAPPSRPSQTVPQPQPQPQPQYQPHYQPPPSTPSAPSALIQAMLARQQAEAEMEDEYDY